MADYFSQNRRRGNSATQDRLNAPLPTPGGRPVRPASSRESMRPPSSIRIRRLPSSTAQQQSRPVSQASDDEGGVDAADFAGRRRSMSAPQRFQPNLQPPQGENLTRQRTADHAGMRTITEGQQLQPSDGTPYYETAETPRPFTPSINVQTPASEAPVERVASANAMNNAGDAARRNRGLRRFRSGTVGDRSDNYNHADEYDTDVVDLLDLIDPEVRTIGTLTNVQNSLFIPDLGGLINRRPTYQLTPRMTDIESRPRSRAGTRASQRPLTGRMPTIQQEGTGATQDIEMQPRKQRTTSISSQLSDSHYAVLPHGVDLEDWSPEEIDELNDHVRHLLHSRKEGFKRGWRGFRQYLSKPLGLFVFVYATLVTLFGAAWVFCLIGWIYVGSEQDYFINVIDNVLVALFALMGDGLAPFRAVDTYHMCFIAHYHHLTWRLRGEKKLPGLVDENDLPDRPVRNDAEMEDVLDKEETAEFSVLSPRQQKRLQYHQAKFSKAHTFYKPHETATHHAFPLRLLVAVVVLLDCHSLFQVALGTCTWSIDYHSRPEALTATILSCSITCNIMAGVVISIGDHKTRKKDVLERIFRQGLTEEAIRHVQKKHTMSMEQERHDSSGDGEASGSSTGIDKNNGTSPGMMKEERGSKAAYEGT